MRALKLTPWNILWLLAAALYFLVPLYATAEFSLETGRGQYGFDAYRTIWSDSAFGSSFWFSRKLSVETVAISTVLMADMAISPARA